MNTRQKINVSVVKSVIWLCTCSLLFAAHELSAAETPLPPLTLAEAEHIALTNDPALARFASRAQALDERAVADGQWTDPQLRFGVFNLPTDGFSFRQEAATQLRLGLQQPFPRGKTLTYKRRQTEALADVEQTQGQDQALQVLRSIREGFLELYHQLQAGEIIRTSSQPFASLVEITQAHYAAGRQNQQDVLRAQLELSRLDDREIRVLAREEVAQAELAKWLGDAALRPLPPGFPALPEIPALEVIKAALGEHPAMRKEDATVESHTQAVQIALEQYKPRWTLGAEYRLRLDDSNGNSRVDFLAATAAMDLPIFTDKRQDRRLSASRQQAMAARYGRSDRLRDLLRMLERAYVNWQRLTERYRLYEERLLQEARLNVDASVNAYQSGVTEFTTLMRAQITELDTRLQKLQVRVDQGKAQATLLYLAGE